MRLEGQHFYKLQICLKIWYFRPPIIIWLRRNPKNLEYVFLHFYTELCIQRKNTWFKNSHDYSDFLTFPNYMYYDNDVQCLLLSINSIWFRTRLCSPRPAVDYKFRIIWNTCHSQCTDVEYDNCISWHIIVPDNWIPTQVLTSGLYVYRYGKLIIRMLQS